MPGFFIRIEMSVYMRCQVAQPGRDIGGVARAHQQQKGMTMNVQPASNNVLAANRKAKASLLNAFVAGGFCGMCQVASTRESQSRPMAGAPIAFVSESGLLLTNRCDLEI